MILNKRQVVSMLFLFLFTAYWCGITCFTHSHVENGVVIVHSHPFQDAHHTHTAVQYETIFGLTHFFSLESSAFVFEGPVLFVLLLTPFIIRQVAVVVLSEQTGRFLRAPPVAK